MLFKDSNVSLYDCQLIDNKFEYFSFIYFESHFEKGTTLIFDKIYFIRNSQLRANYYTPLLPIFSITGCMILNISNLYFKGNDIGNFYRFKSFNLYRT